MENSSKNFGVVEIPQKKRYLDLKRLCKSRVSAVVESKGKVCKENGLENVKKKRRKSGKGASLSSFEPAAKKSRKEDGNDAKLELGFSKKSSGGSKGLHGISLDMGGNGNTFNFPKHPRGFVGCKKLEIDQADEPLVLSNSSPSSVDCAGKFKDGVVKCKNKSGPVDQLVRSVTPPAGNHEATNSKTAGKMSGSNSKIKPKEDPKSTGKGIGSDAKLKRKVGDHAFKDSRKGGMLALEEENSVALKDGNRISMKQWSKNGKKKALVVGVENSVAVGKISGPNSKTKKKEDLKSTDKGSSSNAKLKWKTGDHALEESRRDGMSTQHVEKENSVVVNNGDMSSQKQRCDSRKKNDLVVGEQNSVAVGKASGSYSEIKQKEDSKPTGTASSSDAKLKWNAGDHALMESRKDGMSAQHVEEENSVAVNNGDMSSKKHWSNSGKKNDLVVGEENSVAVNSGDMSSKKQRTNSRKKKDLVVGEENCVAVNNGNMFSNKQQSDSRGKKKDLLVVRGGGEASKKKSEPFVVSPVSDSLLVDFEEDEENLEQNAARMLSSQFDPSCTGFSSKRISSVPQTVNECSIPVSSSQDSFIRQANSSSGRDFTSADDKNNALKPREKDEGKGVPRKRRHFYEILPRDLDPLWVLNRRIKVFCSLNESWYYGLVNDYRPEWRLYHIKYNDREDDWIDLHDEKFKVLCFPSEVPGKVKSKKVSPRSNNAHKEETVLPEDNDSCMRKYLDSEPIALWLARSSQLGKSLAKSLTTQRISPAELPMASPLLCEKIDHKNDNLANLKRTGSNPDFEFTSSENLFVCEMVHKSIVGALNGSRVIYARKKFHKKGERGGSMSENTDNKNNPDFEFTSSDNLVVCEMVHNSVAGAPNGSRVVYGRKKFRKKGERGGSMSRHIKAYGSTSGIVTPLAPTVSSPTTAEDNFNGCGDSDKQLWSVNREGLLRLNVVLGEFREFRFQICLPVLPFSVILLGSGDFWLFLSILMLKHGVIMSTYPSIILEMLFIDSYLGLRLLHFEGCMNQALAFIFLILILFSQPEHVNDDMQSPVTSIRLTLFSAQDLRKHHIFQFHSFSRLESSKWVYLDSKLLQHCLLIKQLLVSECTYDDIKKLETGCLKQYKPNALSELPSFMRIFPRGFSEEACTTSTSKSTLSLAEKPGKVPQFALSFSAASTFFLALHLQLLMENNSASGNHNHHDALRSLELEHGGVSHTECFQFEPSLVSVQDITAEHNIGKLETAAPAFMGLTSSDEDFVADVAVLSNVVEKVDALVNLDRENSNDAGSAGFFKDLKELAPEEGVVSFPYAPTSTTLLTSNFRCSARLHGMIVDMPSCEQVNMSLDGKGCIPRQSSDVGGNVNEGSVQSPSPTCSRRSWEDSRGSLISASSGDLSPIWSDRSPKLMRGGFSNAPKKRRTQVQYTLPGTGHDFIPKQNMQDQRALPCQRIRKATLKRVYDGSRSNQNKFELLACGANVLVTHGDKGWRECGALIVLEVAEDNEWRLAIRLAGITKYSLKVKHILQPGTINGYLHAMLWKGGKDWVLEFPDKSQWTLFKKMHEECYNRNIRAASVKNIPIPVFCLIEESDDHVTEVPFVQNSTKYLRQFQTDIEMGMDPSHVLYDMDSDDEQWLIAYKKSSGRGRYEEITEEFLEKTMDTFEKVAHVQHRDSFTDAEIQELVIGVGSAEAAKVIYQHWQEKRGRKGMPLIRHLQPPLWARYQQQLKQWEHTVARGNSGFSVDSQEKVSAPEKPPMFAFCLKPQSLDVPYRGSKQRSHRKYPVTGQLCAASGDHDSHRIFGRRSNCLTIGDEKVLYANSAYESSDVSPSLQASMRALSRRNPHFSFNVDLPELCSNSKIYKNKQRKLGSNPSSNNQQTIPYNETAIGKRNEVQPWNMGLLDLSDQRQLNGSHRHQLWMPNASGAAKRASEIAKIKREKARKLFRKADTAMHRAVAYLMNVEATKAAYEDSNGGN